MTSDFRTANLEKKILSRILYLEELQHEAEDQDQAEQDKISAEISAQRALLTEVRAKAATAAPVKTCADFELDVELPDVPTAAKPSYPVYVPAENVLERWRVEAKADHEAYGDRQDQSRRVLVLIESLRDLLRVVGEENIQLDLLPKTEPTAVEPGRPALIELDEEPQA